jgi:hypothetical protein
MCRTDTTPPMRIPKVAIAAIMVVILLICLILAAMVAGARPFSIMGGARRPLPDKALSPHIVVDTLNLTHWLNRGTRDLTVASIIDAIDTTAPDLKLRHADRVMYVVKDRESTFNDQEARDLYATAAKRNGVYVYVVERYQDPPSGAVASTEHSARGRDDFFITMLAHKWRCAVLTEDRMRDFDQFRANIPPFHVYEYTYWRDLPSREFVKPASTGYARLKKARRVGYGSYFNNDAKTPDGRATGRRKTEEKADPG